MRKIRNVALYTILFVLLFNTSYISSFALNDETISLSEYASQLSAMMQEYDYGLIGGSSETAEKEQTTKRLIIKTNENTFLENDCGAVSKIEGYDCMHIMQYNSEDSVNAAFEYYSNLPSVEYVEYDFYYSCGDYIAEPVNYKTDRAYLSWGATTVQSNTAISSVNSLGETVDDIIVAVLDTGLDSSHSFFSGRFKESNVNLVDGSTNTDDDNSHGTHVAGIIVDNTPSNVKVKPYKVLNSDNEGSYLMTCTAIEMAVKAGDDIINMSLCGKSFTESYKRHKEVIGYATENNIPVIVAAGNEKSDASKYCPANNEDVITVAATTFFSVPNETSNYGSCIDIAAPGKSIYSTIPNNGYDFYSGTSMAAPFVSAAAAIMKSLNPYFSTQTIKDTLKKTAVVPIGWNTNYGVGILNMSRMISSITSAKPIISQDSNNSVTITAANNAIIYYTTDGSVPTVENSSIYSNPINTEGISAVRAIACEAGKAPSEIANLSINWEVDLNIRYKGTKSLESILNEKIESCHVIDESIVEYQGDGRIKTHAIGKTRVIAHLSGNRKATFDITVKFADWQFIHKLIYEWFGILLWSF